MAFSTTWSVDKYKSEYESEEHWELRRKFMEAHKDKFPENKLVCLARVFFNVEFLGCRYPEKTMQLVSELSKGVADEFREKQKGKLKRTFVQASDAAGAKIKGASTEPRDTKSTVVDDNALDKNSLYSCFVHSIFIKPPEPCDFPGLIIYEHCMPNGSLETCPINILTQTVHKNKDRKNIAFDYPPETKEPLLKRCTISIDGKILSSATGITQKEAKLNAAIEGLKTLRKSCFTIQAKHAFFSDNPIVGKDEATKVVKTEQPLPQDNIGCRMMQKMGWTGAGLGKQQQGIEAPIQASAQNIQRAGFGGTDRKKLHSNCRQILKDYIASDSDHDLIFSPDFTTEERKMLHQPTDDGNYVEDLFESNPESLGNENSSDEECLEISNKKHLNTISSCIVCNKLKTINGEETGDYILDKMWGTDSDPTGLMQDVSIHHRFPKQRYETDDEICDMDVSDDGQDLHADINSSESLVQSSNAQSRITCEDSLVDAVKNTSPFSLKSFLKGEFSICKKLCCASESLTESGSEDQTKVNFVKIRYNLLNRSFLSICLKCIREDEILNLFTFPNEHRLIPWLRIDVTENDYKNNPLLWDTLMKYAVCSNISDNTSSAGTVNLNNQLLVTQSTETHNISTPILPFTHTQTNENNSKNSTINEISCIDRSHKTEPKKKPSKSIRFLKKHGS